MDMKRTKEWAIGDTAQRKYAELCAGMGWTVAPMYAFEECVTETKAPVMLVPGVANQAGLIVAPDLLLMRADKSPAWVDVKAKSVPSWRRVSPGPRWEHGCDLSIAEEYRAVQDRTGIECHIVVHEIRSPISDTSDSALVESGVWLAIGIADAFNVGQVRSDWPGGALHPQRRGRRGRGGLLWARSDMRRVALVRMPATMHAIGAAVPA